MGRRPGMYVPVAEIQGAYLDIEGETLKVSITGVRAHHQETVDMSGWQVLVWVIRKYAGLCMEGKLPAWRFIELAR